MKNLPEHSLVAMVTPMHEDGSLDLEAFDRLVNWHIKEGTQCIVVAGTTGESPTIAVDEHCQLIEHTVKVVAGRISVMAGSGANSTAEAITLAKHCKQVGADSTLSVVPYYNNPTQAGLYRHFSLIAEAVDIPIVLYNVPKRTVADLGVDCTVELAKIPNIVGLKDASGNVERATHLRKRLPSDFVLYSGDDGSAWAAMFAGYDGTISVTANIVPKLHQNLCVAACSGDTATTLRIQSQLLELNHALFCESSPTPCKWMLAQMGMIHPTTRSPLVELSEGAQTKCRQILTDLGLI